jgi:hypothetical protein
VLVQEHLSMLDSINNLALVLGSQGKHSGILDKTRRICAKGFSPAGALTGISRQDM